jgi:hypothetical protein
MASRAPVTTATSKETHSMFKLIALLIFSLVVALPQRVVTGDDPDQSVDPEMQRQEIINLERETARAIMLNNGTFFRRVYAEDFSGTLSHGQVVDKARFIAEVQNDAVHYQTFLAADIKVKLFQETAIATCLWSARGFYKGQVVETQMRVTHVYINSPRGWHAVAGQNTQLPPFTPTPL